MSVSELFVKQEDSVTVFGVTIANISLDEAVHAIEGAILSTPRSCHPVYIVNAHTLNLSAEDKLYRSLLNEASFIFGDGTGVRWAARLRGTQMKDNLVGTDLVPKLFQDTGGQGYQYFLLGADALTIQNAATYCQTNFPGWTLVGSHHGYLNSQIENEVLESINHSAADVLLVGMGNPKQEFWIATHRDQLRVAVAIGVGGLFDHWGGTLKRAPLWIRRQGLEWLQLLLQQPQKWRRYLIGNPLFLIRMFLLRSKDRLPRTINNHPST